ncbi:MAG: DUF2062 domain-containing protein [Candidatus Acidiferrales bacterium]
MSGFFQRRLVQPLLQLLRVGITPEKIALSLAFGLVLGTFPVLGSTTILCTLAVFIFGLNFPTIQIVNYFVYPLQLVLLVPLLRAGRILFRAPRLPFKLADIVAMIHVSPKGAIRVLWVATLHAMVAWLVVAVPMILILNAALRPAVRRLGRGLGALKTTGSVHIVSAPGETISASATSVESTGKP